MTAGKIAILVAAASLLTAPAVLAGALPNVPVHIGQVDKGDLQAKPASIVYSGDGSAFFAGAKGSGNRDKPLTWTSWSAAGADGTGFNWINNCTPNCAAGTFHGYAVALHLYRPKTVHGHLIFTRLKVTYTSKKPRRGQRRQVWKIVHMRGGFFYDFPSS